MSGGASSPCPPDSALMKAWDTYQESDAFKNSLYWATAETKMKPERAEELQVDPEANRATSFDRERNLKGALWGAFMTGFGAAGGKITF